MRASLWDVEEASSAQVHGCCAQMGSMARSDWKRATSCSVDLDSYYGREKFPLARKGCCDIHCRRVSCGRSKEKEQLVKVCSQTEQEGLRGRGPPIQKGKSRTWHSTFVFFSASQLTFLLHHPFLTKRPTAATCLPLSRGALPCPRSSVSCRFESHFSRGRPATEETPCV
jgi:hypothetical protein